MEILHLMDKTCTANSTLKDFKKDSAEMLALRIVDFKNVQNMSDNIQQLKKEHINFYLDNILGRVKSDQPESHVSSDNLRFLNKTIGHPDKSIAKKAWHIKEEMQKIILQSIEKKNDIGTDVSLLSICEQEILRDLPICREDDTKFTKQVKVLFWLLLDNDMARKSNALHKHKRKYKLNKYFFYQMQNFAYTPLFVPIPNHVRENAKIFLQDIRLYNIDTNFSSRDGGI